MDLRELLNGLDREQLQGLLLKLVAQEPSLQETIEEELSRKSAGAQTVDSAVAVDVGGATTTAAGSGGGKSQRVRVDTKAIRRQVYSALHSLDRMSGSEAYYYVGAVLGELGNIVDRAWEFIKADD